jgi:ligand-binding sensor domain-containing protein
MSFPPENIQVMVIDAEGNIWFGSAGPNGGGITKFDGTNFITYTTSNGLIDNNVHAIAIDSEDNKWFGTPEGVSKFDGITWTNYTTSDGLVSNDVSKIAIDEDGNVWFGTSLGVSKFNGSAWTTYTTSDGLADNVISAIAVDEEGNIWFGTNKGVSKFDGTNWETYTTSGRLVSNNVKAIAIDKQGNKWLGTNEGVSKFNDIEWITYTSEDGLASNNTNAIAIDTEGNKWFGTDNGVSKFDNTIWTTFNTADGLANNNVYEITIDAEGNKWFGTDGGVSKFDDITWTTYTTEDGLSSNSVYSIAIDKEGNTWFGTSGGISKFDGTNWITYDTLNYDVPISTVNGNAIAIDEDNNLWATGFRWYCSYTNWPYPHYRCYLSNWGIAKFDGIKWTTYTTENGLAGDGVNSIVIDAQDNKWFGTDNGVSQFDGTNCWTTYTTCDNSEGIASNYIQAIAIDAEGNKWIGTYGGVSKLSDDGNMTCISVSPINQNVGSDSGHTTFNISSETSLTVSDNADWLTVSPESGNGEGTITAYFKANPSISSRVGTIRLSGTGTNSQSVITVTQEGVKTIILSVSPGNQEVSSDAGDTTFSVNSNINWIVYEDADWLTVNPESGSGNDAVNVSFTANTFAISRVATITVSGTEIDSQSVITFTQRGIEMILSVSPGNQEVSSDAGDIDFNITSNTSFTSNSSWVVSDDAAWLKVNPTSGRGNGIITVAYETNTLVTPRVATITVHTLRTTSTILLSRVINAIAIDAQGNKWFGTEKGVFKFNGFLTNYTTSDGLVNNIVNAIAIDENGNKWFGTDYGISIFDGTNWTNYIKNNLYGPVNNYIHAIAIDKEGNKWFGTSGGVSKFKNGHWTSYNTSSGLPSNVIRAIAIDTEGNKWFGTANGVSKFDDSTWTTYTTSDGLVFNSVHAIAIDDEGNKWFGTTNGVSKFDGTNWTNYTREDGLVNNNVKAIIIDGASNIWFGTTNGISKLDFKGWTTYTISDDLADNAVWAIAIDSKGNRWFGTNNGVSGFEYEPEFNSQSVTVTQDGIESVPSLYNSKVTVYPNPVKDNLLIKFDDATLSDITISIVDVYGRSIIERNFEHVDLNSEQTLDLSSMKSGLYFLEIRSEKGNRVYKIIKE